MNVNNLQACPPDNTASCTPKRTVAEEIGNIPKTNPKKTKCAEYKAIYAIQNGKFML